MPDDLLTAHQFAARKYDLPQGGRWTELVAGRVVQYQPPDEKHGNVVLNLSKSLAAYFQQPDPEHAGYAGFELGLYVARNPDTVRTPPICCFRGERRFADADEVFTENRPGVVAEIASTNDRRRGMAERVQEYLAWGVAAVWVIDPHQEQVHVFRRDHPQKTLGAGDALVGYPALPGFSMPVLDLFAEPKWWRERK
jgi:Uma2 family endonuclease